MRTLDLDLKVGEEERNQEEVGSDREGHHVPPKRCRKYCSKADPI